VPGAVGLDQERDLGFEAVVVGLRGLPAASVADEVVQVAGPEAESGGPGGQLVRLAGLAAVPGRAGIGQSAGAGQEDGLGFEAGQAAGVPYSSGFSAMMSDHRLAMTSAWKAYSSGWPGESLRR
jgi:hypothetical protein